MPSSVPPVRLCRASVRAANSLIVISSCEEARRLKENLGGLTQGWTIWGGEQGGTVRVKVELPSTCFSPGLELDTPSLVPVKKNSSTVVVSDKYNLKPIPLKRQRYGLWLVSVEGAFGEKGLGRLLTVLLLQCHSSSRRCCPTCREEIQAPQHNPQHHQRNQSEDHPPTA